MPFFDGAPSKRENHSQKTTFNSKTVKGPEKGLTGSFPGEEPLPTNPDTSGRLANPAKHAMALNGI